MNGTWVGKKKLAYSELIFNNGKVELRYANSEITEKGTFTVDGSRVTINKTHALENGKWISEPGFPWPANLLDGTTLEFVGDTFTKE